MSDERGVVPAGTHIMMGNLALSEGALAAGCRFFAGYPITPANEVSEYMSQRMSEVGGIFIQMEDEIASLGTVIGAAWAGAKAMTATSGPGFSLMQEHIGHAANIEVPLVIANIQRPGPGGGGISEMSGDVMQVKWGAHGDYQLIALAPSSCQELFDLTIQAFNLAGQWRVPVVILSDALLGHMYEKVEIPSSATLEELVTPWPQPSGDPKDYIAFTYEDPVTGELVIPPLPRYGTPYHPRWAMSSPHRERGGFDQDPEVSLNLIRKINEKIWRDKEKMTRYETRFMDDAEIALICYGTTARPALRAAKEARGRGIKVGYLRLITLWPMPDRVIREACQGVRAALVPEMNYGQLSWEVQRVVGPGLPVASLPRARLHDAEEILQFIEESAR